MGWLLGGWGIGSVLMLKMVEAYPPVAAHDCVLPKSQERPEISFSPVTQAVLCYSNQVFHTFTERL